MKQHYLPECYLKEFCSKGKLFAIDVYPFRTWKKKVFYEAKTPAQVARSVDFYTIQPEFGVSFKELADREPYELEEHFHQYENYYSTVIGKIKVKQKALLMADATLLAYAIVDFKIRNNYFRNTAVKTAQITSLDKVMEDYRNSLNNKPTGSEPDEKMERLKSAFQIDPNSLQTTHIWSQVVRKSEGNSLHKTIVNILLSYQWAIYEFTNGFITSDNPGCSLDNQGIVQNTKYDSEVVVFMPLTPSYCLVIDYKLSDEDMKVNKAQKKIHYKTVDKTIASLINSYQSFHLSQHFFTNNPDLAQEVCDDINTKLEPK